MNTISFRILRLGTAITFILIGLMILQNPETWDGFVQAWVLKLLPIPLSEIMLSTGLLDIAIGLFLMFNRYTWIAATIGSFHIIMVLIANGLTDFTVRDIAILAGTIAIALEAWVNNWR
ncbi:MAG: DoxX family membrane protein [Candidatus Vogelbacteria bacterium]|nr:DoxX family membrane protein [Candidatus Vogelbacteria bacterium]